MHINTHPSSNLLQIIMYQVSWKTSKIPPDFWLGSHKYMLICVSVCLFRFSIDFVFLMTVLHTWAPLSPTTPLPQFILYTLPQAPFTLRREAIHRPPPSPELNFGSKKTGKISIVFEDSSRNYVFFEPKWSPTPQTNTLSHYLRFRAGNLRFRIEGKVSGKL